MCDSTFLMILFSGLFWSAFTKKAAAASSSSPPVPPAILLDVDNTLYIEEMHGIERQIVQNIHHFCRERNITRGLADELHYRYGSTIEGLRQTLWKDLPASKQARLFHDFYRQLYDTVNVTRLLQTEKDGSLSSTGYSHVAQQQQLRTLFLSTSSYCDFYLASNSPLIHISKVLQAMGLARVPWKGIWTPDSPPRNQGNRTFLFGNMFRESEKQNLYPTKQNPPAFFGSAFLLQQQKGKRRRFLLDDSAAALKTCSKYFTGLKVSQQRPLFQALAVALGWLDDSYVFDQVQYLRAKNQVDVSAINRETWMQLLQQLEVLLRFKQSKSSVCIVDIGAGLLSMLKLFLNGHEDENKDNHDKHSGLSSLLPHLSVDEVQYYAYEPNRALEHACLQEMKQLGFVLEKTVQWEHEAGRYDPEYVFVRKKEHNKPQCIVHLRFWDFDKQHLSPQPTPHLIVGCCFADLVDPQELTRSLLKHFLSKPTKDFTETIVYFPITFRGVTQFLPPMPYETKSNINGFSVAVPSDTAAFSLYSQALEQEHGHHLDPDVLIQTVTDYGGVCLSRRPSDWTIDPTRNPYLWNTMLYFFGTVAVPAIQSAGFNAHQWLDRARSRKPIICASNVDLLFRIPHSGQWKVQKSELSTRTIPKTYQEIQFRAPRQVTSVSKKVATLKPNEVLVQSEYSLISSGTELKIFSGKFEDAALDVNIKGMESERMKYPLAYGYCLVGRVVDCGSKVQDAEALLGKLVFAFAPHASYAFIDREALQLVPDGIKPIDAIFMPSVETALSLVHDANPRFGEKLAVFGQGLIGLLVTAILSLTCGVETLPNVVTTFDTLSHRLAASARMGSQQALFPSEASAAGSFDVAIEISGNGQALQSTIDATRDGGRVIIGSWYKEESVHLKLGVDFHRSHKSMKASQVSEIPSEMRATWNKERRFQVAWELTRKLRPSRLITRITTLNKAQEAFEALEKGDEIAVAFQYD